MYVVEDILVSIYLTYFQTFCLKFVMFEAFWLQVGMFKAFRVEIWFV